MFAFFGMLPFMFMLAIPALIVIGVWKVFVKAGQPGWACIIPIYNVHCWIKIGGKEWWWLLLYVIPIVNIVIAMLVAIGVARNFGKGAAFALGLIFLPFIFCPILGFGNANYGGGTPPVMAPPVAA